MRRSPESPRETEIGRESGIDRSIDCQCDFIYIYVTWEYYLSSLLRDRSQVTDVRFHYNAISSPDTPLISGITNEAK